MNVGPFVLVLAAGEGTRMMSATPKVLHPVVGRPLLEHVLTSVAELHPRRIAVIVGVGRDSVKKTLKDHGWKQLDFVVQDKPRGSGHAVLKARPWLRSKKGTLLVVYGDTPLLTSATLRRLIEHHESSGHAATFLTMDMARPAGYGRMILDSEGTLERIVEDRDASENERRVTLVNSGVACWDISLLLKILAQLRPNNTKHEYYLTDGAALLRAGGERVGIFSTEDVTETQGVNTRVDLAEAESLWRRRILERWMLAGVTVVDPATTYVDWDAQLMPDTRLWPGTVIQGATRIGSHCEIGPYTVIEDSIIKEGARIGPFARVRPGSVIDQEARVGNFVEVKKSRIGKGSKVNHLSYVGDTQAGDRVNVGAGTITCNYDGRVKHTTVIENDVFIGSNSNLVAPVRVGRGATVAAGSTVTQNVPAGSLAIARCRQVVKKGWVPKWRQRQKRGPS